MDTDDSNFSIGDFGQIDIPDIDLSLFDILGDDFGDSEQTRYLKPKVKPLRQDFIAYENAKELAKDLRLDKGQRVHAMVAGSFIFGDFIEAYVLTHRAKCLKMTISTLSLSQDNIDSLATLLIKGWVDELNLIVSAYFYSHEARNLVPYMYRELDIDNKFQLAVAGIHTKTAQFETLGGRKIVMHGSANLRSSGNIEQFCIEEDPELYDFYDGYFANIIDTYKTINKPIRGKDAWAINNSKRLNHGINRQ